MKKELLPVDFCLRSKSTHPIAVTIVQYANDDYKSTKIEGNEEIQDTDLRNG
jgi:cation transport ATPase